MATKNRNEAQFDGYREWQWIKHATFARYATPWANILGSISPSIFAVDCCAGAGAYTDPDTGERISEGSPLIFAKAARIYNQARGPGKSMHVICVEPNRHNFAELDQCIAPFRPHAVALQGQIRRHAPAIAQRIGNEPALVILDPIGLKTITPSAWLPLLERDGKTDLFVVLMFNGLHRIGGMLESSGRADPDVKNATGAADGMDRVFRTDRWRDIAVDPELAGDEHREERERIYVNLWYENVVGQRHGLHGIKDVRAGRHAPVKYWLMMTCDSPKAHRLIGDVFVDINELQIRREYAGDNQLTGLGNVMVEQYVAEVKAEVSAAALDVLQTAHDHALPWSVLDARLHRRFYSRAKSNWLWSEVKSMCHPADGRLVRQRRPAAKADPHEIITLGTLDPDDPADAGASEAPIRRVA